MICRERDQARFMRELDELLLRALGAGGVCPWCLADELVAAAGALVASGSPRDEVIDEVRGLCVLLAETAGEHLDPAN